MKGDPMWKGSTTRFQYGKEFNYRQCLLLGISLDLPPPIPEVHF